MSRLRRHQHTILTILLLALAIFLAFQYQKLF